MTQCAILDAYENTLDETEANAYCIAYQGLYGCDTAPYWGHRADWFLAEGVECWQEVENH